MAEGRKISVAEVRRTIASSLAAAFGFVIALMWNNVVVGALATGGITLTASARGDWLGWAIIGITAIAMTSVLVVLIVLVSRWGGKE